VATRADPVHGGPTVTTPFDIRDPLPVGRTTIEASAGTGKTHSLVGLAARYLAEGHCTASQLLVVTFTRSATRELRARLLDQLDRAHVILDRAVDGQPPEEEDHVASALCDADGPQLRDRRGRIADALADIDAATITTVHAFAAQALARIGEIPTGRLLEDDGRLATEIAADLYVQAAAEDPTALMRLPYFGFDAPVLARAGLALSDPTAVIPAPSLDTKDGARAWLVAQTAREAGRRKARAGLHTHDDLLRRLAARLDDHAHGADAARQAGGDLRVALVDEFQDTDPVQWRILSALFPDPTGTDGRSLVLVGDPKQAIYAFRGADVDAYVDARGDRASHGLTVNHRSDAPVVATVLALFSGQPMGRGIDVPDVSAVAGGRLHGLDTPPVCLTTVPDDAPVRRTSAGAMQLPALRDVVAADVARQTVELLGSGATIDRGSSSTPVGPADVAILVRTRAQAAMVQRHLVRAGVPCVLNGVGDVLGSPAARDWATLLRALDRPSHGGSVRLAALTDLVGWTPAEVASADDDRWDDLHIGVHRWRQSLLRDGPGPAFRHLASDTDLAVRLLGRSGGDRRLTDLQHLAEVLHDHAVGEGLGPAALLSWLERGMAQAHDPTRPVPPDHLASRLERGGDAVQILTVHGAKGLQFGIVLAPFLWDAVGRSPVVMPHRDPADGRRKVYVGTDRRDPEHHRRDLHVQEQEAEERRLAYVAMTRARHHLRIWFAPGPFSAESPLGTLLARPTPAATTADAVRAVRSVPGVDQAHLGITEIDVEAPVPTWSAPPGPAPATALATLGRGIDGGWRRTSYSRLVGSAHAAADVAGGGVDEVDTPPSRSPDDVAADEAAATDDGVVRDVGGDPGPEDPELQVCVPLAAMRGGADVGTAVHAVLEHVDFAAADLPAAMSAQLRRQVERHAVDLGDDDALDVIADGLVSALRTPLRPGGPALAAMTRSDRVDELAFEIPVVSHESRPDRVLLADVAGLLDTHLGDDDPLAGYADALRRDLGAVEVRGYLAGYIDLLARVPGTDRFVVVDHKTNRMAPAGTDEVTLGHFTAEAMAAEMIAHHYPLQALVYAVAVHRYLRWRLEGYDPDRHLDGIAYLFVRGMVGPDTPVRDGMVCGVFRWRPPTALLHALDRLLADGRAGAAGEGAP
jgi:exodeoxyribonuclease V beta subunit